MGTKSRTAAPAAALALGLLFAFPACIATDVTVGTIASLVAAAIGNLGFISPAMAEPLTKKQSDALDTYNNSRSRFEQVLRQRRTQINSKQGLPNLPGQALYLARNNMISAYKDLTDALPSRTGGPNKYGIPPAYFSADNEPLLDEYRRLFDLMQAPPANAQNSDTPFKDVVDLGTAIARAKGLDAANAEAAGRISLGLFFAETNGNQNIGNARSANDDQKVGVEIVRRALQSPVRQIAENAGFDGAVVAGKMLDQKDANFGFDAQKGDYVDMIKAGIIDPVKVVRTALQDAASVAGLLVTTEAMVAEKPEKKAPAGMPPGGGMGGDMDF
jgi:hypothetical protein